LRSVFAPALERQEFWHEVLSKYEGQKVGLNWSGNVKFSRDEYRSIPLETFLPLSEVAGVQLISLQQVNGLDQIEPLQESWNLLQPGAEYQSEAGSFSEAAALIQNLDLVITSDTATAHLAGSLGVPVWVLVSQLPEWRWLLDRTDSPWYPTAHLFRQENWGSGSRSSTKSKPNLNADFSRLDSVFVQNPKMRNKPLIVFEIACHAAKALSGLSICLPVICSNCA